VRKRDEEREGKGIESREGERVLVLRPMTFDLESAYWLPKLLVMMVSGCFEC